MKPVAALANCAWLSTSLPAWARFRRALDRPEETQREILRTLLARHADCVFGRAHRFGEIGSVEEFHRRVPIADYDGFDPWITRLRDGEQSVLTSEPVTRLLPTSGSSGARKLIPFTAALQREFNAAIGPWIVDLCREFPEVPFGPAYWSISPVIPGGDDESSAIPIGFDDDSAYLGGHRRRLVEAALAAPSALRLVDDTETFRYLTLLSLLRQPHLRLISVWHPSFLSLLLDALPGWWTELVDDIHDGTCRRANALPAHLRPAFYDAPQPTRAFQLRQASPLEVSLLWPHLRVISCWGDAQATLAFRDLQRRLPSVTLQRKGLLSTEAFVSIPFLGHHPVAIASHFYEFIDESGSIRLAHELREGDVYDVIVTTGGGLWRYALGDRVEVDGFVANTPSLRFLGRSGNVSDLCGEKLSESFVTRAIAATCQACEFTTGFALLAPERNCAGRSCYTLFVEGSPPPNFPVQFEDELRRNPHYDLCRRLGQLGVVQIFEIAAGAYEIFCRLATQEGRRLGDIKPQHLSSRPDWRHHFISRASVSDALPTTQ